MSVESLKAKARRWTGAALVTLVLAVLLAIGGAWMILSTASASRTAVEDLSDFYLQEIADQTADHFQTSLQGQIAQLDVVNRAVREADPESTAALQALLGDMRQDTGSAYLAYVDDRGMLYTGEGVQPGISKISNLPAIVSSSEPLMSVSETVGDTNLLLISVPIEPFEREGVTFVASLAGLPLDTLSEQLSLSRESAQTFTSIVDPEGAYIVSSPVSPDVPNGSNLFSMLERAAEFEGGEPLDQMRQSVAAQEDGYVAFRLAGQRYLGFHTAVPDTDYSLITIIPYDVVNASMSEFAATLSRNAITVMAALTALGLVAGALFLRNRRTRDAYVREQQASRTKSEFLSRMSHEIRTPMNGIIGMTTMALRSTDDPKRMQECLEKTLVASDHLLALLNDVLDMSRIESGRIEITSAPFDLQELAERAEALFGSLAQQKDVELSVRVDERVRKRYAGDALRIGQVVNNLLSNAVKFTDEGGSVTLEVTARPLDEADGLEEVAFVVADTGCGIAPENLERVFEAFEQETAQVAGRHGGTGLGLSIVKRLCELMGGSVEVESELGRGSVFTARIPLPPVPDDEDGDQDETALLKGLRILVVEDNVVNMEIVTDALEWAGADVERAWNGREGVDAFAASEPGSIDLVLMDVQMPVMNGLDAARALRALPRSDASTVPILAASANTFEKDDAALAAAGMSGHVQKPVRPEEVARAIARIAGR
ncbi:hypothetical protein C1878_02175 [Gordonibacter sp. 28C]|uniref:hybrid sensor histidine kinase/response regulator n=1 Tax=Gordonibacter sp. 28C TaxID=2078569 RepID=UPI000DF8096B|nr:hybrid sensor histidine kinase/response regulator [Gordonibacter sp. 28C]RDB64667.1 hypothetical protein C1878_02175 [Gordonibacter sp. 28C]